LPYWQLNHNADLPRRADFGAEVPAGAAADAGAVGF
jgi:hypothetical protein